MARKNRKNRQRNVPQTERARRHLEKGDTKSALKEAKRCFRADPSHANRELLERALFGRVEQLYRMKNIDVAKAVLAELLELRPTTPQVTQKLPRLQVIVGDANADAGSLFESDPSLLIEMVDQAVLDERSVVPDHGDVKSQVAAVREAFAAVERGDDDQAAERLTIISKNSPLADWRLLVRGLSAFYQQDQERTAKNWDRLDAHRPANRIAQTLLASAGIASGKQLDMSNGLRKLELHSNSDPAINILKKLAESWRQGNWQQFFRNYRQLCKRFADSHETLIRQIVDLVWKRAVQGGDRHVLSDLSRIGPAPVIDPSWKRARALLSEHPESPENADEIEDAWVAYAEEIKRLACLREEERPFAVGLVYQRLGRLFTEYADEFDEPGPFFDDDDQKVQDHLRRDAARNYRKSIQACPSLEASHLELAKLHEQNDESDKAAKVLEKLARQDPDCFEAVIWLANYFLSQDDPGKSERYVKSAMRLRPRDPQCTTLAWNQRVTMIRCLAIKRQFQAARQEIDEAAEIAPPEVEPYTLDLIRAGVEFKAKNLDAANAHVDAALFMVEEPTPIWLQMSYTTARMRVARELKKDFDDRFKVDIKKTPTSYSAGRMARFLLWLRISKINYTGRATQEKLLIEYLRRAATIQWNQCDLRNVCNFLGQVPRQGGLRAKFVNKGIDRFPDVPHFHLWTGLQEVDSGPFHCDKDEAVECLQKAIDLHSGGEIKLDERELESARSALSMVKDFQEHEQSFASASPFFDDDECDEDFDEEDDFSMPMGGFASEEEDSGEQFYMPTGEIDEATVKMLERTMPPEIRRKLQQTARMMGLTPSQTLRLMIASMENAGPGGFQGDSNAAARPRKKRRKTARR